VAAATLGGLAHGDPQRKADEAIAKCFIARRDVLVASQGRVTRHDLVLQVRRLSLLFEGFARKPSPRCRTETTAWKTPKRRVRYSSGSLM
jgi:hypothetical protein